MTVNKKHPSITWTRIFIFSFTALIIIGFGYISNSHQNKLKQDITVGEQLLPTAMAVQGYAGAFDGIDYRGVPVLAAIAPTPDTPWFIVSKVDTEEIYAPLRQRAWSVIFLVGALLLAAGSIVGYNMRRQAAAAYKEQYELELKRHALLQKYEYLTKYANDIILMFDNKGKIIEVNERAEKSYGFSRDELLQMYVKDLRSPETRPSLNNRLNIVEEAGGSIYETVHQRKDGTTFPIEASTRNIEIKGELFYQAIIRDISERKKIEEEKYQAQEELLKEKTRLDVTLSSIGDAVIAVDKSGVVTLINPVAETLTGWSRAEAIGQPLPRIFNIINEYTRQPLENPVYKVFMYGNIIGLANHTALIARDGSECSIADSAAPILDASGNIQGVVMVFRDVTEDRRKEEIIINSEIQLRRITDNMQDIISEHDLEGSIQYVSPSIKKLLGYKAEHMIGKTAGHYIHPDDLECCDTVIQEAIKTAESRIMEYRYKHINGHYLWLESICNPLVEEDGTVSGLVLGSRDVTKRKQADEELIRSRDFYLTLFEKFPALIWRSGTDAKCDYFNSTWLNFTGRTMEQELGDGWAEGVHPEDLQRCINIYLDAFGRRQPFEMEYRLKRYDGVYRWIIDYGRPFNELKGNFAGFIGLCYDITGHKEAVQELFKAEREKSIILDSMKELIIYQNTNMEIIFANKVASDFLGLAPEELVGRRCFELWHNRSESCPGCPVTRALRSGKTETGEITLPDGIILFVWGHPIFDNDGEIAGVVEVGIEITARKRVEQALFESEEKYRLLFNSGNDAVFVAQLNKENQPISFIEVNNTACLQLGYTRAELLKLLPMDIIAPEKRDGYPSIMEKLCKEKNVIFEIIHMTKSDSYIPVEVNAQHFYFKGQPAVLAVARDITDRKRIEERLQYLATHDSLTNIPNRYFLDQYLERAVEKAKRGVTSALLFIDIDNFKLVNDTYGHVLGDEVLVKLASVLKNNLRAGDFIARFGGDEFTILLEDLTEKEAGLVAEKLRVVIDEGGLSIDTNQIAINLTISVGVVMIDGTQDTQKLLAFADTALYEAKEGGRNRVVFTKPDNAITEKVSEINQLISLIKNALRENRLVLHFQPIFDINNGKIYHHEALVRMQGKNGQLIMPGRFIPVAERFGMMSQIDYWVVKASIKALLQYDNLKLFINLSGASLGNEKLLEQIEMEIRKSALDSSRIGFEITESNAVKDLIQAGKWIRHIKGLGCNFALDDFGIGFSSFSYLRMLPVDYLKIDGSFIRNIDTESNSRAIVQAMNEVAHALNKKTIAEFVENERALNLLSEIGVDYAQGYHLGKPLPYPVFKI